jgi:Fe-S cluster assembly protein SufD
LPSVVAQERSPAARELYDRLLALPSAPFSSEERASALDRFFSLPSGRERPGRFWRVDFESLAPEAAAIGTGPQAAQFETREGGVTVCDLATAAARWPELLARAFGATAASGTKFGSLTAAFAQSGAFVHVRADHASDEPVVVTYRAPDGGAIFPWTVLLAERGSRVTLVERIEGAGSAFVCGTTEIVTDENAEVCHAVLQRSGDAARVIWNRFTLPGRDAHVCIADAELGGALSAGEIVVSIEAPGSTSEIAAIFFPGGSQHVDIVSTVDHRAGEATSETLVKSAARERGQARFLGNIRIAPHAQGSDARLRDDALLLSPTAHVDSVPALEIGANDVKAYHGATVGAMDAEQIFYMESRGIERLAAERMIALGFFEPAIERFPTVSLRDEIRAALAGKLS